MKLKRAFEFELKSMNEVGQFEGLASTYHKDLVGDVIEPGAFKRTIDAHVRGRKNLPVLWQHNEPIGKIRPENIRETGKGLSVMGELTMSVPLAQQARDLALDGVLGGMSIGFEIPKGKSAWEGPVRKIREVRLWEVSLVTFPANPKAVLTGVKGAGDMMAMVLERAREAFEECALAPDDDNLKAAAAVAATQALALLKADEVADTALRSHSKAEEMLDGLAQLEQGDPEPDDLSEVIHSLKELTEAMENQDSERTKPD